MVTALNKAGKGVGRAISFSTVCWGTGPDDTFMTDTLSELFWSKVSEASRQPVYMTKYYLHQEWLQAALSILKHSVSASFWLFSYKSSDRHVVGIYTHFCSVVCFFFSFGFIQSPSVGIVEVQWEKLILLSTCIKAFLVVLNSSL